MNAARGVLFWHVLKFTSYVWGKAGQMAGLMATLHSNNAACGVVSNGENRHGGPQGDWLYNVLDAERHAQRSTWTCTAAYMLQAFDAMHNAARGVMHSDTTPRAALSIVNNAARVVHDVGYKNNAARGVVMPTGFMDGWCEFPR